MADVQLLKDALRLYKQALQQTPGGTATLGRLALKQPDLLARLMAYESAPAAGVDVPVTRQSIHDEIVRQAGTEFHSPPLHGGVTACLPQLDAATVKAGEPEDVRAWLDSRRNAGVAPSDGGER